MPVTFLATESDLAQFGPAAATIADIYGTYVSPANTTVEISCVGIEEMQRLNNQARGINEPTDVLSFPLLTDLQAIRNLDPSEDVLIGSIVISPEKAALYNETLPQLLHHGMLHICGFDHETDIIGWRREESHILDALSQAGLTLPGVES